MIIREDFIFEIKRFFFNKRFSVYDEDSVGSDFLGEYRLKLSTIRADVKEAYSVYLQNKTEVNFFFAFIYLVILNIFLSH